MKIKDNASKAAAEAACEFLNKHKHIDGWFEHGMALYCTFIEGYQSGHQAAKDRRLDVILTESENRELKAFLQDQYGNRVSNASVNSHQVRRNGNTDVSITLEKSTPLFKSITEEEDKASLEDEVAKELSQLNLIKTKPNLETVALCRVLERRLKSL